MLHSIFKWLLVAATFFVSVDAGLICPLCGSAYKFPTRWDYPVGGGKTCRHIFFEMAYMQILDARCSPQQEKYKSVCCDAELPPGSSPQQTPQTPGGGGPRGNEPGCAICPGGVYPGSPNVFISARYVGTYSCGTLYHRGNNG